MTTKSGARGLQMESQMTKNRYKIEKNTGSRTCLEKCMDKWWKALPLDTEKQWFCMGEVAFFNVSSVFKKLESYSRNCLTMCQNPFKSGSEGSPKRSLKMRGTIKTTWWENVSKMRSTNMFFWLVLILFWGLGPKVSQGGARDLPRVPPGSKKAPKWVSKWLQNHQQMLSGGFLKTLLKDTRTQHVSKQLFLF